MCPSISHRKKKEEKEFFSGKLCNFVKFTPFNAKPDSAEYNAAGLLFSLNKNDVKLFGSTINTQCNPEVSSHVQSYIFSVDREALEHLIYTEIFSLTNSSKTFQDAITNKEIKMSRDIIDNNWNIGCLHRYYKDIDFRYINKLNQKDFNYVKKYGDIMVKKYQNYLWKNKELVFVKGNRLQLDNI